MADMNTDLEVIRDVDTVYSTPAEAIAVAENMQEIAEYVSKVQALLRNMQDKFQSTSDQITNRIDDMTTRVDELEKNIADVLSQAIVVENVK